MSVSIRKDVQPPALVARRFGRSLDWAELHVGDHKCVDGLRYVVSCLVTDPSYDKVARSYMGRESQARRVDGLFEAVAAAVDA